MEKINCDTKYLSQQFHCNDEKNWPVYANAITYDFFPFQCSTLQSCT